ncbi:hypothetical protein BC962_2062 [Gillisia mitskevichiae]|uniref:Uncharacterized protein n=1 Tax=Gillisia mitskevichiae TaxID=270921 RepID=A0A495PVL1_9FLAO|nr:hypothetical protein BC962_2062 [Gillisia mitskevichiae]
MPFLYISKIRDPYFLRIRVFRINLYKQKGKSAAIKQDAFVDSYILMQRFIDKKITSILLSDTSCPIQF